MMSYNKQRILVVAGEASGDLHGSFLIRAVKRLMPQVGFYGVGGPKMREAGCEIVADISEMAVVGLTEVLTRLPKIYGVMRRLEASIEREKPLCAVLIDYPDFNLRFAKTVKQKKIKVFYYISPQIWAWRAKRIEVIKKYVDKMVLILPFEESIYHSQGIDATFVGHPLLEEIPLPISPDRARRALGIDTNKKTVALLPGSRASEVARHLPLCLAATEKMKGCNDIQFLLALAEGIGEDQVSEELKRYKTKVYLYHNSVYNILAAADVAVVASGTATLEAALMNTPMVIIYRMSWLSYLLGRLFVRLRNIGLVNIIAGKEIVPELIQKRANPVTLANLVTQLLHDRERREEMKGNLQKIREKLGQPGASQRAAMLLCQLINEVR